MENSQIPDSEKESLAAFCEFVEAAPVAPSAKVDSRVMGRIQSDLCPSRWLVFGKLTVIETAAGIATLLFCPQFGIDFGIHNDFFHTLHERVDFFSFYLICGLLFIVLGAAMGGLLLSYNEIQLIKKSKYVYYLGYGLAAYLIFFQLGVEILLVSAIPWILGAFFGNLLGFGLVSRMRVTLMTSG